MDHAASRNHAYERAIGNDFERFLDVEGKPPIEVRRYNGRPVSGGPECNVWVTWGMSDSAMHDEAGLPLRREMIFYGPPGPDYSVGLRAVARYPFENDTFIDHGHSIQTFGALFCRSGIEGRPSEEAPAIELPHLVLLSPLLRHHRRVSEELIIEHCSVEFLWVVPISVAEHALKKREGTDALLELLQRERHPWLFNPERKSYVSSA